MLDPRFKEVVAVVEATSTEQHFLWKQYHTMFPWESESKGFCYSPNPKYKNPTILCFFFVRIGGKMVAFYEGISEVVDHREIKKFINDTFTRIYHADAMNFSNILEEIYPNGIPKSPVIGEDFDDLLRRSKDANQQHMLVGLRILCSSLREGFIR